MAEIEQAPNPQLEKAIGVDFKQFPFLKQEQAAGEKASEAKIKAERLKKSVEFGEERKALEKISSEDKAFTEAVEKQQLPPPKFEPTQDNALELGGLFSIIATMGVALGGGGKLSSMNALNAMGGMLKGYQSGRKDLFEKEQKIFDKETSRIKDINDRLIKKLDQYQKLRVTDKEAARLLAQEIASENPGVYAALVEAGRLDVAYESAKKGSNAIIKMMELAAKNHLSGKALTKDILPAIQGIRGINDLETQLNDPEVQAGLKAKVAPILEKIASLGKKDFEAAVNENLTGTDKTTLFLKSALLESYAIERAALGGGRLTVQMMKQAGPVLDPTNYRPETYKALLEGRRRQLYNNLQDLGMSQKDIEEKSAEHAYTPYGSTQTQETSKRTVSGAEVKQYYEKHKDQFKTEDEARQYLKSQGYPVQ